MTLRKYKKLLMSCGLDRNLAEFERRTVAKNRAFMSQKGFEYYTGLYEQLASRYVSVCGGSLRKWEQMIRENLKYIKDHCTV